MEAIYQQNVDYLPDYRNLTWLSNLFNTIHL